jgi:hypothetical protein
MQTRFQVYMDCVLQSKKHFGAPVSYGGNNEQSDWFVNIVCIWEALPFL